MKCILILLPLVALAYGRTRYVPGYASQGQEADGGQQWTGYNWMENLKTVLAKRQMQNQQSGQVGLGAQEGQRADTILSRKLVDSQEVAKLQQLFGLQVPRQQGQQSGLSLQQYGYPVEQISQFYPSANSWYQTAQQYQPSPYENSKYGDYQQFQGYPYGNLKYGYNQQYQSVPLEDFEYGAFHQNQAFPYGHLKYNYNQQYQSVPFRNSGYDAFQQNQGFPYGNLKYSYNQQYQSVPLRNFEYGASQQYQGFPNGNWKQGNYNPFTTALVY